ncbi:MAG: pyridoxamine 5'-phosphate oxidase family protein [Eubacteriales bacterium]|nr:pyridoxamine 5'-phosphate oxidase family protein [Eubacteriales bacterium]
MRRVDREMDKAFALEVVDKCQYGILSIIDENQLPYGVPLSVVRDNDTIYFHSANAGKKVNAFLKNKNVCLTCVGDTNLVPENFTTEYESAIINGSISEVMEDVEKIHGLKLICEKYASSNLGAFDEAIKKSLWRTAVFKISIDSITGKRKKYDKFGKELKFRRETND